MQEQEQNMSNESMTPYSFQSVTWEITNMLKFWFTGFDPIFMVNSWQYIFSNK